MCLRNVFIDMCIVGFCCLIHLQKNAVIVESVLLRASLPLIHANAVDLLRNLITR